MLQAMFSGVSGLQTHQTRLDVIGNNIANVNTLGFKAGRVTFEDQLSQTLHYAAAPTDVSGGVNPAQVGLGVSLGAVDTIQTQGNLQTTGKSTDLAIQGNGYFLVAQASNVFYTRDGSFDLDSFGVLVNPGSGYKLLGWTADKQGVVDTSKPVAASDVLKIPLGNLTDVKQTTAATFSGNLSASAALESTYVNISGPLDGSSTPPQFKASVYDSLGNTHAITVDFSAPVFAAGVTTWTVNASIDGNALPATSLASSGAGYVFAGGGTVLQGNVVGTGTAGNFPISLDFGGLTHPSTVVDGTNGKAVPPTQSTTLNLTGPLSLNNVPAAFNTTVYDAVGVATTLQVTFSNPTLPPAVGPGVPVGATSSWDVLIKKGVTTLYDSTAGMSKMYFVPGSGFVTADTAAGTSLGGIINLSAAAPGVNNIGQQVAAGFPVSVDLSKITSSSASSVSDGIAGPPSPVWNTSLNIYDELGFPHSVNVKFTRALVGAGAPGGASARWEWTATENGNILGSSTQLGSSALFFNSSGALINQSKQNISIAPTNGAKAFTASVDFSTLSQLSSQQSGVAAESQDGYPVGTLQTYSITDSGLITGVFTNGQSRSLGQVALASFANPSGLEKAGQNLFSASNNSGPVHVGPANTSGRGKINTGYVEMSNVDLSTEFTNLIVTQRGFQANTRIIKIVDDLLQDVINLKA